MDGGAQLGAARDRAVAAVVHAFGRGHVDDDTCAQLLDDVQAATDMASLDHVMQRLGAAGRGGTRPLTTGDMIADHASGGTAVPTSPAPATATRCLDAVDLALAARAGGQRAGRRSDPRLVSLVVVAVVLVVLAVLGVVLIGAVRSEVPGGAPLGGHPPGAARDQSPGSPGSSPPGRPRR